MSRKKSTLNTGLKKIIVRQEKARAIGLKGTSNRALNPQGSYRLIPKLIN